MPRLTVLLLAACLASLVAGPALAQSASPSPAPLFDRQLLADVKALLRRDDDPFASGYWSTSLTTTTTAEPLLHNEGDGSPVRAAVDVLDLPPEQVRIFQLLVDDREGDTLIVVDGLSVPGASTEALVDGIVAWADCEWRSSRWDRNDVDMPSLEEARVGAKDVLTVSFATDGAFEYIYRPLPFHGDASVLTGDGVEYIYASGDSAIKVLGETEQDVLDFLGRLP